MGRGLSNKHTQWHTWSNSVWLKPWLSPLSASPVQYVSLSMGFNYNSVTCTSSQTRITLEGSMVVETTNDGVLQWVRAGLVGFRSDTKEVGDDIAIQEEPKVCCDPRSSACHVEA